jgi:cytoskeletal protein CcmA (bactofilin family)
MNTTIDLEKESTTFTPAMKPDNFSRHSKQGGVGMDQTNVAAFIGHGVEFKGVIRYEGNVRIDGQLDGEVHANGTLYLGEQAVLTAKISAQAVISKGKITGDITAREKVQLLAPAIVDGSVLTPSLLMEEGVTFNGTLEMMSSTAEYQKPKSSNSSTTERESSNSQKDNRPAKEMALRG